jgi:hypothetical protein
MLYKLQNNWKEYTLVFALGALTVYLYNHYQNK